MDHRGCASASRAESCDLRSRFRELPCGESNCLFGGTPWGPHLHRATADVSLDRRRSRRRNESEFYFLRKSCRRLPVQKIHLRIDLSSIEERGKVSLLLREDFQELPTNPEDDLGPALPLLSPFRGDYDPAAVVHLLQDCAHGIYPTICHAYRIMVKVVNKDDFYRKSVRCPSGRPNYWFEVSTHSTPANP